MYKYACICTRNYILNDDALWGGKWCQWFSFLLHKMVSQDNLLDNTKDYPCTFSTDKDVSKMLDSLGKLIFKLSKHFLFCNFEICATKLWGLKKYIICWVHILVHV